MIGGPVSILSSKGSIGKSGISTYSPSTSCFRLLIQLAHLDQLICTLDYIETVWPSGGSSYRDENAIWFLSLLLGTISLGTDLLEPACNGTLTHNATIGLGLSPRDSAFATWHALNDPKHSSCFLVVEPVWQMRLYVAFGLFRLFIRQLALFSTHESDQDGLLNISNLRQMQVEAVHKTSSNVSVEDGLSFRSS
ncbi:unnamed protein product [Protopolystoma xenopodis]|uniref:Uncharacterized protein n=1 Tax=Protopolystoma xenopodis TaxID=117903 RepID=A0A3S5FD32_9PLAT|nr:unnamed protein product [Protopolystoma xenopodis]